MSDYQAEEVLNTFIESQKTTIAEMYSQINVLETKVQLLEKTLREERQDREEMPVPKSFIQRTQNLMQENEKMKADLEYYKKFLPDYIIINRENVKAPTRRGGIPKS